MRLFVSIDCPESIIEQLLSLCDLSLDSASWNDPDQFHLTLQFIGEVDEPTFQVVVDALADIQMETFDLSLMGLGFFPPRKMPRILWVGVEKNEALLQLQKKIESRLRRLHLPLEKRKFHPHITLARLHHPNSDELGRYLAQNNLFHPKPFPVESYSLYSSLLGPQGAVHTEEAHYRLR